MRAGASTVQWFFPLPRLIVGTEGATVVNIVPVVDLRVRNFPVCYGEDVNCAVYGSTSNYPRVVEVFRVANRKVVAGRRVIRYSLGVEC